MGITIGDKCSHGKTWAEECVDCDAFSTWQSMLGLKRDAQKCAEFYEARGQEPVAWRYMDVDPDEGESGAWNVTTDKRIEELASRSCRVEPLYAAPVPAQPSAVADICNAYESGVGHRGRKTAKINPYQPGTPEHEAYAIGAEGEQPSDPVAQPPLQPSSDAEWWRQFNIMVEWCDTLQAGWVLCKYFGRFAAQPSATMAHVEQPPAFGWLIKRTWPHRGDDWYFSDKNPETFMNYATYIPVVQNVTITYDKRDGSRSVDWPFSFPPPAVAQPAPAVADGYVLVPEELASQLQPGMWQDVYIGTRHKRLDLTYGMEAWTELMGLLAASAPPCLQVNDDVQCMTPRAGNARLCPDCIPRAASAPKEDML